MAEKKIEVEEKRTVEEWRDAKALTKRQWVWCKAYCDWAIGKLLTEKEFDLAVKTALSARIG